MTAKVITPIKVEQISDDVLKQKAEDEKIPLAQFGQEVKKHENILKRIKKIIKSLVFA